jgi:hypothetical protein
MRAAPPLAIRTGRGVRLKTTRIKMISDILLAAAHSFVVLARQAATLDILPTAGSCSQSGPAGTRWWHWGRAGRRARGPAHDEIAKSIGAI